jgi:hypothetical protein
MNGGAWPAAGAAAACRQGAAVPRSFDSFCSHSELNVVKVEQWHFMKVEQWHFMRNAWRQDNGFNNQRQREGGREMSEKEKEGREREEARKRQMQHWEGKRFSMRREKKNG